jgi:hypothetical protein
LLLAAVLPTKLKASALLLSICNSAETQRHGGKTSVASRTRWSATLRRQTESKQRVCTIRNNNGANNFFH